MKKVLLIIALFMLSLTLKAVEPTVKFYLEDGDSKEYRIEDFIEMSFKKSDAPYLMKISSLGYTSTYNTKDVYLLELIDTYTLKVNLASEVRNYDIRTIDSITFVPNPNNQLMICGTTWMGKNLDVEYYRNGDIIPQVTDSAEWQNLTTGAWCYYNNNPAMGAIYGKLYNGFAVMDPRGLAPVGWHIPNYEEWTILTNYLGGENNAGGKLKSMGTSKIGNGIWQTPNKGATNETGFSALPGGTRDYYGVFQYKGYFGYWWGLTKKDHEVNLSSYCLDYSNTKLFIYGNTTNSGFAVRCIKD